MRETGEQESKFLAMKDHQHNAKLNDWTLVKLYKR